jgi:HAD superfamily hydrolase (TIGR01509 family)
MTGDPPAVVLDIDGTLVDSNFQHAWCWHRALRQHGQVVPLWRVHRIIGMGGDRLVAALTGDEWDAEHGDDVREAEKALYFDLIHTVLPLPGARDFVLWLADRGHRIVLSSSAKPAEVDHYLGLLDVGDAIAGHTNSGDVENAKPEPDVVNAGLKALGHPDEAVMIGDSVYDVQAASGAGLPTIGLLTGGFGGEELREVGATEIYVDLVDLRENVRNSPLGGGNDGADREH